MSIRLNPPNNGKKAAQALLASNRSGVKELKRNFLIRLFCGDFPLVITFWIFFLSVPLTAHLSLTQIFFPWIDTNSIKGAFTLLLWILFIVFYLIIASIGLWKCVRKDKKYPRWHLPSRIAAGLGILLSFAYPIYWYGIWLALHSPE